MWGGIAVCTGRSGDSHRNGTAHSVHQKALHRQRRRQRSLDMPYLQEQVSKANWFLPKMWLGREVTCSSTPVSSQPLLQILASMTKLLHLLQGRQHVRLRWRRVRRRRHKQDGCGHDAEKRDNWHVGCRVLTSMRQNACCGSSMSNHPLPYRSSRLYDMGANEVVDGMLTPDSVLIR